TRRVAIRTTRRFRRSALTTWTYRQRAASRRARPAADPAATPTARADCPLRGSSLYLQVVDMLPPPRRSFPTRVDYPPSSPALAVLGDHPHRRAARSLARYESRARQNAAPRDTPTQPHSLDSCGELDRAPLELVRNS